jgi:hypothetical protein
MTYISGLQNLTRKAIRSTRLIALAAAATFMGMAIQPAQAQNADYWKSAAIIGGATAAGAYIGHKVAGTAGTVIGAGVGGSMGYAIDARRRRNSAYNQAYAYGDQGQYGGAPYGPNGQYDPNAGYNGPYSGNGQYGGAYGGYGPNGGNDSYGNGGYNGPYAGNGSPYDNGYPYPGFQSNKSARSNTRFVRHR